MKKHFLKIILGIALCFGFTFLFNQKVSAATASGWYSPFSSVSDNIICKVGKPYTMANMKNGNCKVDWGNIVHNVSNNIAASFGDLHNPLP